VLGSKDRLLIHEIPNSHFFKDTETYSSFIRLRREHLERLGVQENIEIGLQDYLKWQKQISIQSPNEEVLFQMGTPSKD
jgi:hypothetical protein